MTFRPARAAFLGACLLSLAGCGPTVTCGTPELAAAWWQWAFAAPTDANPVRDLTGAHCAVGQSGDVWFLAGGFGSSKIRRNCTVPAGKTIFLPVINNAYWPRTAGNGLSCADALESAMVDNDTALELFAELDGDAIADVSLFRVSTPGCFDIFARVPREYGAYNAFPSAADGYWMRIDGLASGHHTLKFGGRYNSTNPRYGQMVQDIEYELVVE